MSAPAVPNGDGSVVGTGRSDPTTSETCDLKLDTPENVTAALEFMLNTAINPGDTRNALKAVELSMRMPFKRRSGRTVEEQETSGADGFQAQDAVLTDEDRRNLEERQKLSSRDRMLMCEGYSAMDRIVELDDRARRRASMSDLLDELREEPEDQSARDPSRGNAQ
jgi:hypothetical protein